MKKIYFMLAVLFLLRAGTAFAQQTVTVVNNSANTIHYYLRMGNNACVAPFPAGSKTMMYSQAAGTTSMAYDFSNVTILSGYPAVTCAWTFDGISFNDACSPPPIVEVTIGNNPICGHNTFDMLTSGCYKPSNSINMTWNDSNPMAIVVTVN